MSFLSPSSAKNPKGLAEYCTGGFFEMGSCANPTKLSRSTEIKSIFFK